jgi:adenosylmethionine-8-amino-7-oxononanoate aminotransferase
MSSGLVGPAAAEKTFSDRAKEHLWMQFTPLAGPDPVHVIVRGEGAYVWDDQGRRYLDGLSGLFTTQIGHGRRELAEAAAKQAAELAYFPLWTYAHPKAIELAERIASLAPGDLNRVFFTSGGSEAVESAWKLVRHYFNLIGEPHRYKLISRDIAYHGTTMASLTLMGVPALRAPFEPLPFSSVKVPNTNFYRAPIHGDDVEAFGAWAADEIERAILREGPELVAAVFVEPLQASGGCIPPPPGYLSRVRKICDKYGVLMVSDEVICAFGRLGEYFGSIRYDYQPDIITVAKGLTSGYAPLGAMIARECLVDAFRSRGQTFAHGLTFSGHPVSCAVALANLDVFEREDILGNVREHEAELRGVLEGLRDLPIVGDVRGDGYLYAVELVKDRETRETFEGEEADRLLRGYLSPALFEAGLICRADDRGDPVVTLAPPLTCGSEEIQLIGQILRDVLSSASKLL